MNEGNKVREIDNFIVRARVFVGVFVSLYPRRVSKEKSEFLSSVKIAWWRCHWNICHHFWGGFESSM